MNKNNILLIVPTRSAGGVRVDTLEKLIESWHTTTNGQSDMLVAIDPDEVGVYLKLAERYSSVKCMFAIAPITMSYAEKLNWMISLPWVLRDYDIIGHPSDDHLFVSKEWEIPFVKWISYLGVGYGDDLLQGANLPTCPFISSNILKGLGFMCPLGLKHMFVDNFWKDLGLRLGCLQYFPEVIIEHVHWTNKKAPLDAQYTDAHLLMEKDRERWDMYRNTEEMEGDVQRVRRFYGKIKMDSIERL